MRGSFGGKLTERGCGEKKDASHHGFLGGETCILRLEKKNGGKRMKSRNMTDTCCTALLHTVCFIALVFSRPFVRLVKSRSHQYWMSFISLQCGSCQSEHASAANRKRHSRYSITCVLCRVPVVWVCVRPERT